MIEERAGKTPLVQAILAAFEGPTVTVRCRRNDGLAESVRELDDRAAAERMLDEIARIRSDDAVRTSVLGRFAHRTKITAVVARGTRLGRP